MISAEDFGSKILSWIALPFTYVSYSHISIIIKAAKCSYGKLNFSASTISSGLWKVQVLETDVHALYGVCKSREMSL